MIMNSRKLPCNRKKLFNTLYYSSFRISLPSYFPIVFATPLEFFIKTMDT
jgi:hypothetical protein